MSEVVGIKEIHIGPLSVAEFKVLRAALTLVDSLDTGETKSLTFRTMYARVEEIGKRIDRVEELSRK